MTEAALEYVDSVLRENRRLEAENAALRAGGRTGCEGRFLNLFLQAMAGLAEEPGDAVEIARREDALIADFAARIIVVDGRGL